MKIKYTPATRVQPEEFEVILDDYDIETILYGDDENLLDNTIIDRIAEELELNLTNEECYNKAVEVLKKPIEIKNTDENYPTNSVEISLIDYLSEEQINNLLAYAHDSNFEFYKEDLNETNIDKFLDKVIFSMMHHPYYELDGYKNFMEFSKDNSKFSQAKLLYELLEIWNEVNSPEFDEDLISNHIQKELELSENEIKRLKEKINSPKIETDFKNIGE